MVLRYVMKRNLLNFILIKLTACLVAGIIIGSFFPFSAEASTLLFGTAFFANCIFFYFSNRTYNRSIWFGLAAFALSCSLGILTMSLHDEKNHPSHYTNHLQIGSIQTATLSIREVLRANNYNERYIADIITLNGLSVSGKVLVYVKKDSLGSFDVGDRFLIRDHIQSIRPVLNPHQFDYKRFLQKQYIYHQVNTRRDVILPLNKKTSIHSLAASLRYKINIALTDHGFKGDELSIFNALLLGQRNEVSTELRESYTSAGAIHILAVSGLHVGILLLLMNTLFSPLLYLKNGKTLRLVFLIIGLWSFAIIAGLSASVVRAVTMFTAVALSMHLKRATNTYNTLVLSMFFLLLARPNYLFDVGFQLSYAAVFSIVWIQPLLAAFWIPRFWALKKLWELTTVTFSAQLGVLPISLLYFHQFPGLFFVSNLIIVPFLGLILGFGILVIALSLLGQLPEFLMRGYQTILEWMNGLVRWISKQEAFIFKDVAFDKWLLVSCYLLIIMLVKYVETQSLKRIIYLLSAVLSFQVVFLYQRYERETTDAFLIFHKSRHTAIVKRNGERLHLFHSDSASVIDKTVHQYALGVNIEKVSKEALKNVFSFKGKTLLVIDSLGIYKVEDLQPYYLLLTQSPKIHLERVIDYLKPKRIIVDGSNYHSYIERWRKTCQQKKLPFHYTGEKGAFEIE